MSAMPNRPDLPSQPSLFDAAPAAEPAVVATTTGSAPAQADSAAGPARAAAEPAADSPQLPLPAFLADPPRPAPVRVTRPPLWARVLGWLIDPWLKLELEPNEPGRHHAGQPVCYVLEDYGLSNALILERACREAGLPSPLQPMAGDPLGRKRAYVALSRRHANALGLLPGPEHKTHSGSLARLLEAMVSTLVTELHRLRKISSVP